MTMPEKDSACGSGGSFSRQGMQIYTLGNDVARVRIANYGARLLAFEYGGRDVVYGPKTADAVLKDTCYCGAICGRVANRIAGASLTIGDKEYRLYANDGENHLHGGRIGFSHRYWKVEKHQSDVLELTLESPSGEEGYPGHVRVRAVYRLQNARLSLTMEADTTECTALNLTNHVYWNLLGEGRIDDLSLSVAAESYTPMAQHIPTGEILPVQGTLYDLRSPVQLGKLLHEMGEGLDDNYALPHGVDSGGVQRVACLKGGGLRMELSTDAPGLQVYTGDWLSERPRGGIALEAQGWPDAPHHPDFPSIMLDPGEVFTRTVVWQLV